MKRKMIRETRLEGIIVSAAILIMLLSVAGCYNDKEENLYPGGTNSCDTSSFTYSRVIAPIISANCNICHGGGSPSGFIKLDVYSGVKTQVDNGRLWGAITHAAGYQPMPKDAASLSDCNIARIRLWIAAGALNN
jgi:hypothetical protein